LLGPTRLPQLGQARVGGLSTPSVHRRHSRRLTRRGWNRTGPGLPGQSSYQGLLLDGAPGAAAAICGFPGRFSRNGTRTAPGRVITVPDAYVDTYRPPHLCVAPALPITLTILAAAAGPAVGQEARTAN